jgi:hypothetical protein
MTAAVRPANNAKKHRAKVIVTVRRRRINLSTGKRHMGSYMFAFRAISDFRYVVTKAVRGRVLPVTVLTAGA